MATFSSSLGLGLLLTASMFVGVSRGIVELDTHCATPDPFPLDFDLFLELLSNHTDIASGLRRGPIFGDMNADVPAYEITGSGFHITSPSMSQDIKRALCSNNEVTFYAAMFLTKSRSSGTLLEISSGDRARLPVFGVSFNAAANEIMFTYRHRGTPHTVSVDQRIHRGRWRKYAFVLSGHLLQFYYDCNLVFSDIVPLPDFCADDGESFMVSFAEESERGDVTLDNGIHAIFQNVGFHFGRGGLGQQCPGAGKECPTCGQYLRLVERAYSLQDENDHLRAENEMLKAQMERLRTTRPPRPLPSLSCTMHDNADVITDGDFIVTDSGICYCRDGELHCDANMVCEDNSTIVAPVTSPPCDPECDEDNNEVCDDGRCVCDDGFALIEDDCVDQMCRDVNDEDLALGESSYLYQDNQDRCRVFTCQMQPSFDGPVAPSERFPCSDIQAATAGCTQELDTMQRNLAICCQLCTPCNFLLCGEHAHCGPVDNGAECHCDRFYQMNADGQCVDIDECADDDHSCVEFEMCVNEEPQHHCVCMPGYTSVLGDCQDINECEIPSSVCPENSACVNGQGNYTCECDSGFVMRSDGQYCSPVCAEPCQNGGTCVAPDTCACLPGYTGPLCVDDVNECETPNHLCTHIFSECINTIGGHFCRCRDGYQGNGTYCEDIDECESDIHECAHRGPDVCINIEGSYYCSCNNVDCTGSCRRRGKLYDHGESFIDEEINECNNCTCSNGEVFCQTRNCDGDCNERVIDKCCSKCASRNCYLEPEMSGHRYQIVLRPSSIWTDPSNPCMQWKCSSKLKLTSEDLTSTCPPLPCTETVTQPGRCCPICRLPSCDEANEGVTMTIKNGCEQCTCEGGVWNCRPSVECPQTNCSSPKDILFYENRCCPVCEADIIGSTCQSFSLK